MMGHSSRPIDIHEDAKLWLRVTNEPKTVGVETALTASAVRRSAHGSNV
jgi:hypothetical protein